MVRRAIIPAAGKGTRMRPFSELVPKELVPLGSRPALHLVVEEALAAGLGEIVVVVAPGKELLRRYLEVQGEAGAFSRARFTFVVQPEPRGLGDALLCCREVTAGEPFALLLPDNVALSPEHRLADMVAAHRETGKDVLGVLELDHRQSGLFGRSGLFAGEELRPRLWRLDRLLGKEPGTLEIAPGELVRRTCGRFVCTPRLLEELARRRPTTPGELDEVPAYQRIVADGEAVGWALAPPLFDVGHPDGLLAACGWLHERRRRGSRERSGP
jgi:UTP--glucose-1-phosphate uridylyltransferase